MFRRSYGAAQYMDLTEAQFDSLEKDTPLCMDDRDSLGKKLEKFGFVKGNELLLDKFKYDTTSEFQLKDQTDHTIQVKFYPLVLERPGSKVKLSVFDNSDSAVLNLVDSLRYETMQDFKYAVLDIIPGGFPEIVLLNQWYIANGDNFEFFILEITRGDLGLLSQYSY